MPIGVHEVNNNSNNSIEVDFINILFNYLCLGESEISAYGKT